MKIAIKFGDNDFYNCFYGVLETIKNARKWNDKVTENKKELCKIINEISYGLYLLYQNSFEYNEEKSGKLCNLESFKTFDDFLVDTFGKLMYINHAKNVFDKR